MGGVNSWWLANFAGDKLETYGFKNCNDIYEYLEKALDDGELICTEQNLYYISNVPYTYAINTDSRNSEDILPSRNQDPVLTLHVHYFETADLMFRNYNKINKEMKFNDHLSQHNMIEMRIYFSTWLGFLGVVCEGFRKLNVRLLLDKDRPSNFKELLPVSDGIGKMMKEHSSLLRVFRNNVFHLRENTVFLNNFLDKEADFLPWASKLHMEFSSFFSQYTILCEAHYVINGRKGESGLIK